MSEPPQEFICSCGKKFPTRESLRGHCASSPNCTFPERYKKKNKKEEAIPVLHRACGVFEGRPFESVYYEGRPAFLLGPAKGIMNESVLKLAGRNHFEIHFSLTCKDYVLKPLSTEIQKKFPYRPYRLDRLILDRMNEGTEDINLISLYSLLLDEYRRFLDLPEESLALNVVQTLETYQSHKFMTTSYLSALGDKETGKSRFCELHSYLDYRPMFGIRIKAANVYEYLGYHQEASGTIIDDEIQEQSEGYQEKLEVYRAGYRRGGTVARIIDAGKKTREQRFYDVFCPKMFAGYWLPSDEAFKDRCIIIRMKRGHPPQDEFLEEDLPRFDEIKTKLLFWRLKTYFEPSPEPNLPDWMVNRQKELWKPKLQSCNGLPCEDTIRNLAMVHLEQRKENEKTSLIAMVAAAAAYSMAVPDKEKEYTDGKTRWISFRRIWTLLMKCYEVDYLQWERDVVTSLEGEQIKKYRVGKILSDILGAKSDKKRIEKEIVTCRSFDETRLLGTLKAYYLVDESVTEVTQVTAALGAILAVVVVTDQKDTNKQQGAVDSKQDVVVKSTSIGTQQQQENHSPPVMGNAGYPSNDKPLDDVFAELTEDDISDERGVD